MSPRAQVRAGSTSGIGLAIAQTPAAAGVRYHALWPRQSGGDRKDPQALGGGDRARSGSTGANISQRAQAAVHGLPCDRVIREIILAAQPSKRFGTTKEVPDLALFLCGEAARSITGAAIPIDGGWTGR